VLHHLADPAAGLRALVSVLRPGGLMRLGLYSERARRDVVAAREFIAAGGYGTDGPGIRRCRAAIMAEPARFARVLARRDFYTTSACRDLLFHVQERRFTIPAIAELLAAHDLRFVGFLLEPFIARRYAMHFPDDRSRVDLERWDAFEAEFPDIFAGMYRFWVQRPA
jgi:SAM-dependent methyltransferase